jgi:UDPglucose 6-dehydrogenase
MKAILRQPVVVDLRKIYRPSEMRAAGFRFSSIGRR